MLGLNNLLEILFLSGICYLFMRWLQNDSRNLLIYFYGYWAAIGISYYANFAIMHLFLLHSAPFIFIFFILLHQEVIQKNFITFQKTITHMNLEPELVPENLVRAALYALNGTKHFLCIIQNDATDLSPFLTTPFFLHTPLTYDALCFIIDSSRFDHQKFIWCTASGSISSVNASLQSTSVASANTSVMPQWQQDALLLSVKTNTIILHADPATRSFDCVIHGTIHQKIPTHAILPFLKKNLHHIPTGKKSYEEKAIKYPPQQPSA